MDTLNPNELVHKWLADLAVDRSAHTVRLYRIAVEQFLGWYIKAEQRPLTLEDLTPIALVGYRNTLQHILLKAPNTINAHVAALRTWCMWLVNNNYLATNPALRLRTVSRQESIAPKALKGKHIDALLRETQRSSAPTRNYAILQMLIQTGMRIGECVELYIEDISFGYRSGSVRIRAGKGNKARTIPLNRSARKALAEYLAPVWNVEPTIDAVASVWPPRVEGAPPTPLWMSRKHNRLSNPAIRRMIAELVKACARRQLVPAQTSAHTFRHTFAIHYLQNNPGDVFGLATLLGHSSLNTTRLYSQLTSEQLATRVDLLSLNAYGD